MIWWRILFALTLVRPVAAFSACEVTQRASVPLEIVGGVVLAPVTVNGLAGTFILDTGAAQTVVTPDAVDHFGLKRDEWTATTMHGIGGMERRPNATPRSLEMGGVALRRRSLARDSTLRVAALARITVPGRRIDGLLGRDILSVFDLDLDFPHRTLTLYDTRGCTGAFLPWTEPYWALPVTNPIESALVVAVELDGVALRALLDTGTSQTLVAATGMVRLDLVLERLRDDPGQIAAGLGPHTVTMWQHQFRALRIAGETFDAPRFLVAPVRLYPATDMLLGADWLISHRVWISFTTNQLFAMK